MARDYKNAGTRKRSGRGNGLSGGAGLGIGLTLGVVLAAGVHLYHTAGAQRGAAAAPDEPATDTAAAQQPADEPQRKPRFDFYRMLPNYEVVIPEQEDVAGAADELEVQDAGVYVLQAGSFREHEDADRLRAQLALLGIESRIQQVTIDGTDTWHRVRIGPIDDLQRLQELRVTLARNQVEALVIRVGD